MREKILEGSTTKCKTACGVIFVTVNIQRGKIFEVFVDGEVACKGLLQAAGRLISLALRNNINSELVIKQLKAMRCFYGSGMTCGNSIAECLKEL